MKRKIMFRLLAGITAFVMALGLGSISIKAEDITQTDEFLAIIGKLSVYRGPHNDPG